MKKLLILTIMILSVLDLTAQVDCSKMVIAYTSTVSSNDYCSGTIHVDSVLGAHGDPKDFTYIWEHDGWTKEVAYNDTIKNLCYGYFTLTVTDTAGCFDTLRIGYLARCQCLPTGDSAIVYKFTEVADTATLVHALTGRTIKVTNFGDYLQTSEPFLGCFIYDVSGRAVKSYQNRSDVPVSDLTPGVYIFYFEFKTTVDDQYGKIVQRFYIE